MKIKQGALDKAKADLDHGTYHFPDRRRGDLAQRGCWPDCCRQSAGAGGFSNRRISRRCKSILTWLRRMSASYKSDRTSISLWTLSQPRRSMAKLCRYRNVHGAECRDLRHSDRVTIGFESGMTANVSIIAARKEHDSSIKCAALRVARLKQERPERDHAHHRRVEGVAWVDASGRRASARFTLCLAADPDRFKSKPESATAL